VLVYVGVKVNAGVFVAVMVDVPVRVGISVGTMEVAVKDGGGSIVRVAVGVWMAVGVDTNIIGITLEAKTITTVEITDTASMMAKTT
jgi:hypothetical protein